MISYFLHHTIVNHLKRLMSSVKTPTNVDISSFHIHHGKEDLLMQRKKITMNVNLFLTMRVLSSSLV